MGFRFPVTDVMEDRWYDKVLDGDDKSHAYFAIEFVENSRLVGFCSLTDIDYQSSNAQFGIMIGDTNYQGKGVGAEALTHAVEYAFKFLNLHRVYVMVRGTNERAANLFSQAGFKNEGVMREHYYVNGHYEDVMIMSLLKIDHPSLLK